jgi:competence protein ComEC
MIKSLFQSQTSFLKEAVQQFRGRSPCILALAPLVIGILVACWAEGEGAEWAAPVVLISLAVVAVSLRFDEERALRSALAILFLSIGFHIASQNLDLAATFEPGSGKRIINANVASSLSTAPGFRTFLLSDGYIAATGELLPGFGRLGLRDNNIQFCAGDRISFSAKIRKPSNRGNPGEYDWEMDCLSGGIFWMASVQGADSVMILSKGAAYSPTAILFRVRKNMIDFLDSHSGAFLKSRLGSGYPEETALRVRSFMKAIVVGDLGEMDYTLRKWFSDSGLAHQWSPSGSHVAIVAALALLMGKCFSMLFPNVMLWIPFRKLAAIVSIPGIIFYCLVVGARVPAIRSMIMGLVLAGAILLNKNWSSLNALSVAALIILLINPLSLVTPSFQLSFAAVAGILFVVSQFAKILRDDKANLEKGRNRLRAGAGKKVRALAVILATSVAATAAVTPLLLQLFHSFPVYTLPANLLAELFMGPGLCVALIASVIGSALPELGRLILIPGEFLCWLTVETARFFASLPVSTICSPHMSPFGAAMSFLAAGMVLWAIRRPTRANLKLTGAVVGLVLAIVGASRILQPGQERLRMVFINVGKGDSALVLPPSGRGGLVDAGVSSNYFDAGASIVMPVMSYYGLTHLDGVIVSHPEMDHMGGFLSIMGQVKVDAFHWNPVPCSNRHFEKILHTANLKGTPILEAGRNVAPVQMGRASMRFLNAKYESESYASHRDLNNASVICKVAYGEFAALFTGDLETEGEEELLQRGLPLKSTVLKVGHHGGKRGTSERFLLAVQPKVAILSAEYPPNGGLPSAPVLERLKSMGIDVYWTGRDGAIIIDTDGKELLVTASKGSIRTRRISKRYVLP